jgi:2,3-bisphosphoglycerate-independent phosphoglycerate mutase
MSAFELTAAIVEDIKENRPDFICLNFANTDMVGHTGDFKAAMRAAAVVDSCVKKLVETALDSDYDCILIADHGNSDYMINEDGTPNTAHTKNPVPCILVGNNTKNQHLKSGKLADVAPTLLHIMGLPAPEEMTGISLIGE